MQEVRYPSGFVLYTLPGANRPGASPQTCCCGTSTTTTPPSPGAPRSPRFGRREALRSSHAAASRRLGIQGWWSAGQHGGIRKVRLDEAAGPAMEIEVEARLLDRIVENSEHEAEQKRSSNDVFVSRKNVTLLVCLR